MDNSSPPAPISLKSPISLNLAFLIITLVSLLLSAFFIYQNWRLTQKLDTLIKSQPTPTPSVANPPLAETPSIDATSFWKVINNKFWIFKVPPDLNYFECSSHDQIYVGSPTNPADSHFDKDKIIECNFDQPGELLSVRRAQDNSENTIVIPSNTDPKIDPVVSESKVIQLDGKKAVFQRETTSFGQGTGTRYRVYVNDLGYTNLITFNDINQKGLFDQILSTFKFLGQGGENTYRGKYFSVDTSTWKLLSDANQSPATPEVLETVLFENGKARMNVQVGTDSVEKVLSSQDGNVVGKQAIGGVEATKKSGYGGIAGSVYSVSLVASFNEKTYLISFYTLDVKNINDYEKSFNEVVPIFKFTQ